MAMPKYLIVNADDFGASPGVNRGILEAHSHGIVTSTSLMVDGPAAVEAARLARSTPRLGVGLHVDLSRDAYSGDVELAFELTRQVGRFVELIGGPPSHVDSHRDIHRAPPLLPAFVEVAQRWEIPLRGHSTVRCLSKFYGQWAGESHPEQLGVESLAMILESGVSEGVTELICHPGYHDAGLTSSYAVEREVEVATLCDPRMSRVLADLGIELVSFDALGRLATSQP